MTIDDVLQMDFTGKSVLIIGCPASGKTHLSNLICPNHTKLHSDDYMHLGYDKAMYAVLGAVQRPEGPYLVEGVQGYRLLRKGVQMDNYYPGIVIELIISPEHMLRIYKKERDLKKIRYLKGFNIAHQTILDEYRKIPNRKPPEWIRINNDY